MKKPKGFASRFADDDVVADDWRKPANKLPERVEREERPVKRGFGSRFEDTDQDRPSRVVTREEPVVKQEIPKAQSKSRGFASRFKDDDEDKPVNLTTTEPKVEPIITKPKVESKPTKGFASRFKDDDEEEDKPRAFINKIKTITTDVESSSKLNSKEAIAFKKKNRIIEEDFSEDEADNNSNKDNSKFDTNEFEFEPKKSVEKEYTTAVSQNKVVNDE